MMFLNKQVNRSFQIFLIIALGFPMFSGCQKVMQKVRANDQNITSEIVSVQEYYTPLDSAKFDAILDNTDHFSGILICYSLFGALVTFAVNSPYNDNLFSDINGYQGELLKKSGSPPQSSAFSHDFSVSETQDIFDYLSQNSAYFFNGEEFEGIYPPPVLAITIFEPVCSGRYAFSLHIGMPNSEDQLWTIQKCVDEYPEPGTPLYGLFQMLENDFIPQFEEE